MIDPSIMSDLLEYEPDTGALFWKCRDQDRFSNANHFNSMFGGKAALTAINAHGYRHGNILGKTTLAHRAAWCIATGDWPVEQIDHVNGDRLDNRLCNLREVSNEENSRNAVANHLYGISGVFKRGERWGSRITVSGKIITLGTFDTYEQAVSERLKANIAYGFSDRHGISCATFDPAVAK